MRKDPFHIEKDYEISTVKENIFNYLKNWIWFAGALVVFLALAFLYLKYSPIIYQTTAKIKIIDKNSKGIELSDDISSIFESSKINLENEIEVLKSFRLLEKVVRNLELTTSYFEEGQISRTEVWTPPFKLIPLGNNEKSLNYSVNITSEGYVISNDNSNWKINFFNLNSINNIPPFLINTVDAVTIKKSIGKTYSVLIKPIYQATTSLSSSLSTNRVGKNSDILSLSLKNEDYRKSESILNEVIEQFNQDGISDRQLVSQRTIDFVDERFKYLVEELDSIETNKKQYKQHNQLSYIKVDAEYTIKKKSITEEEILRIETQLTLAKLLKKTVGNKESYSLLPNNIGIENVGINDQINLYNKNIGTRERVMISAGINNPTSLLLTSQLDEYKKNILNSVNAYEMQLSVALRNTQKTTQKANGLFYNIPKKEKTLRSIERQQNIKESLYILLLQKREEATVNLAITEPSIKIIDYAITNLNPISPKPKNIYLGAIMLGFLIPFVFLYIYFLLDTKVHSKKEVIAHINGVPFVGEIPLVTQEKLFQGFNDTSILAEAFRILRTNINHKLSLKSTNDAKVIYTASSIKGEGKTFIALNLAIAYSTLNKKVLLVGADFRNPQLHSYTNKFTINSLGLSNYLNDPESDWKEHIQLDVFKNFDLEVLFSGPVPPTPAELLSNNRFELMLNEAKTKFDYIIIDTAPIALVTDTLLISKYADIILYTIRSNYTDKNLLSYSQELHQNERLENMAYVLNGVDFDSSYNYGYNYGYGNNFRENKSVFKKIKERLYSLFSRN